MPACRPTFYVIGKSSQGIFHSLRGQVDRLPLGIVEARCGPKGRAGGWVDRRITQSKLPRSIERDDRPAEGDMGCCQRRIRLSRGNGTENKGRPAAQADNGSDSSSGTFPSHIRCKHYTEKALG